MFCVYLTVYSGLKIPPFYIGSTSLVKLQEGYCGSVSSKKYRALFNEEKRDNRELFTTNVLSLHATRKEALQAEWVVQNELGVVQKSQFMNMALACAGGCAGMDVRGELNPRYGCTVSEDVREKISKANLGFVTTYDTETCKYVEVDSQTFWGDRQRYRGVSQSQAGKDKIAASTSETMKALVDEGAHWFQTDAHKKLVSNMRRGVPLTPQTKSKISETRKALHERLWEFSKYAKYDWNIICELCDWNVANYVKWDKKFCIDFSLQCSESGLPREAITWLKRKLARSDSREALLSTILKYKEERN